MVLDLAQFLSKLLHNSPEIGRTVRFATPGVQPSAPSAAHQITPADLQQSRIHRALLLVTGRGTRWPRKLIEQCDLIASSWTDLYGPLEDIRPLLYEKGGRLAGMMDERDLSRHVCIAMQECRSCSVLTVIGATGQMAERPQNSGFAVASHGAWSSRLSSRTVSQS